MKHFFIAMGLILSATSWAETSLVIPAFLEAAEQRYLQDENHFFLRPQVRAVLRVLEEKKISREILAPFVGVKSNWELPADDVYDGWINSPQSAMATTVAPALSLHATKLEVVRASEFKDDIYAYFFITDGAIPTGKVTSIYPGIASGQSFYFNAIDRAIFPLIGITAKAPDNHLIVDYGIVESDGDDIKKLQQLSSVIIDIAIAVYTARDPQNGQVILNLRKEIKALADLLISFNSDDRLVTASFGYTTQELAKLLEERSFVDLVKKHKKSSGLSRWEYDLHFRLVR